MSKGPKTEERAAEYDFANMSGGVQGKFAKHYKESSNVVQLDPCGKGIPQRQGSHDALRRLMSFAEKTR